MSKITLEKILRGALWGGIFLIFLLPLFITQRFIQPFIFGKAIIFRAVIEIMLVVYLTLLISNFKKYRPRLSGLFISITVFVLIMILSTIFSVNPYHSFWGNMQRMESLLSYLHYWVLFLILISFVRTENHWQRIFNLSIFTSLVVSIFAIAQKFGFGLVLGQENIVRVTGTIGNPAFLAAYLILNCGLILLMFKKNNYFWLKVGYWLILIINLIVIYLSNTRGELLAVFVGFVLFTSLYSITFKRDKKVKYLWLTVLLLIIFVLIIRLNRQQSWVQNSDYLGRLVDVSTGGNTIKTRLMAWQIGWQGFKEKPLLGWGPENYNVVFNKYFEEEYLTNWGAEIWYDRAHNTVVETAVTSGIIGLISYLVIFIYPLPKLWQLWRQPDKQNKRLAIILTTIIITYFIQNLFIFDTINSYIMIFLIFAFIDFVTRRPAKLPPNDISAPRAVKFWPLPLLIVILIVPFIKLIVNPSIANASGAKGQAYFNHRLAKPGLEYFQQALNYNTFGNLEIRRYLFDSVGEMIEVAGITDEIKISALNLTVQEAQKSLDKYPEDVRTYIALAKNYSWLAIFIEKEKNLSLAEDMFNQAIPLSPKRQQIYNELAFVKLRMGKNDEAINLLKQIISTNESIPQFHWNLFLAYEEIEKNDLAEQELARVIELDYPFKGNVEAITEVIEFYINIKKYEKTIPFYLMAIEKQPDNANWYSYLAAVYKELGDNEKAKEWAWKAVEINPDFQANAEEFIDSLE